MSAALGFQLSLVHASARAKKTSKAASLETMCKCGREQAFHANRRNTGACAITGCKRFRPRKKPPVVQPPHLLPPDGAIILERDDTKNEKSMGWATVREIGAEGIDGFNTAKVCGLHAIIYLAQLKTRSLNKSFFGGKEPPTGAQWRRMHAWQGKYKDACRERATSAIAQLGVDVAMRGRPSAIVVTRVSPGMLDAADNLRGAVKFIVDGVAEALGFNDAELEDGEGHAYAIGIRYAQEKCPPKVCGIKIELTWRA